MESTNEAALRALTFSVSLELHFPSTHTGSGGLGRAAPSAEAPAIALITYAVTEAERCMHTTRERWLPVRDADAPSTRRQLRIFHVWGFHACGFRFDCALACIGSHHRLMP